MDTEKRWWDAFGSYGTAFEIARPDYESLDAKTRTIGALMKLELDMYNGGFIQFFCNWGYSAYLISRDGLEQIGAVQARDIITAAFTVIDRYESDERIKELWDIPSVLSEEDSNALDELDKRYWENTDNVMEKMLSHFAP